MFSLCEQLKWSHLPMAGGIYDQDPELLDGFRLIFSIRAEHEAKEAKDREREQKKQAKVPPKRSRR